MTCFECGDKTETYPWFGPGDSADIELCEYCHPKCDCGKLMVRGGEGGCAEHEKVAA